MYEKNAEFSQEAAQQLELAQQAVREMLEKTRAMFDDIQQIQEVYAYHQVVSELLDRLREKHIERLKSSRCMVESGLVLTDLINYYERIAVRCQRIAGYLMQEGNEALKIHRHEYWFPQRITGSYMKAAENGILRRIRLFDYLRRSFNSCAVFIACCRFVASNF